MTVQNIARRAGPFVGDGLVTSFPFGFKVFNDYDVLVNRSATEDDYSEEAALTLGLDYTVTLNEDQDESPGGTVTLMAPLAAGLRLAILSDIIPDQQTELTNHDGFWPETLNDVHDKAIALIQELKEQLSRAVLIPSTSPVDAAELIRRILEAASLAEQVLAIADAIRALGPVADDIAALGPHADAIQRISDRLGDLLQIDGIIGAIEDIEKNVELSQDAAEAAQAAADRAEELLGDLEGVFEENEALAALTENYMLILTSTAAAHSAAFTRRDIEHYHRWEREGIALLRSVGSLALTRAEETRTDIEHWQSWYENGIDLLRRAGTIALYAADASENDCEHFIAWFRKAEEHETAMLKAVAERARETRITLDNEIYAYHDDIRTRALLIRTYVEKPPILFIVAGQSNSVGNAEAPGYEVADYAGQFWNWRTSPAKLAPLRDPVFRSSTRGTAWPAFGRAFFELTGRKVVILSVGSNGSYVTDQGEDIPNTWYGDDSTLRQTATREYQACIAALGTKDTDWVLGGLIWIQGEQETGQIGSGSMQVSEWIEGTLSVFSFFRTLTGVSTMPIYLSQIGLSSGTLTSDVAARGYAAVQEAQVKICTENDNDFLAFTGAKHFLKAGYMVDTVHYNQKGYNILGEAVAQFISNHQTF